MTGKFGFGLSENSYKKSINNLFFTIFEIWEICQNLSQGVIFLILFCLTRISRTCFLWQRQGLSWRLDWWQRRRQKWQWRIKFTPNETFSLDCDSSPLDLRWNSHIVKIVGKWLGPCIDQWSTGPFPSCSSFTSLRSNKNYLLLPYL